MGREDKLAGGMKQVKGKANDTMGALKGDTSQQIKGKVQKAALRETHRALFAL